MLVKPVIPFEPVQTSVFPDGDNWIAQVKWDGVRMLVYGDGTETRMVNRSLHERTLQYPELTPVSAYCDARSVVLDGEIISLKDGRPSFSEVMRRDRARTEQAVRLASRTVSIVYMVFDVLYLNDVWITDEPLAQRQERLAAILRPHAHVQMAQNERDAQGLFAGVQQLGMEGVVVKDLNSRYLVGGKDNRWRKIKNTQDVVTVVAGVTLRDETVNALLLGLYDPTGQLLHIGHVGTGSLTESDWRLLMESVRSSITPEMPYAAKPELLRANTVWLQPKLTVKVRFLEWTRHQTLRQPVFEAFVEVPPQACVFEDE